MRTLFLAVLGLGLAGADDPWDDATTQDLLGHARAVSLQLPVGLTSKEAASRRSREDAATCRV